jgi:hypothetical protein
MLIRKESNTSNALIKALFVYIVAIATVLAIPIIIVIGKVLAVATIVYLVLCWLN